MQQKGAKVLCACHGGGYGLKMESMNFEDDISDITCINGDGRYGGHLSMLYHFICHVCITMVSCTRLRIA